MKKPGDPVSTTELNKFKDCNRLWAAHYLAEWPREDRAGFFKTGTGLHTLAESYLLHGTKPYRVEPIAELFLEMLPHLPAPGTQGMIIEASDTLLIEGIPFSIQPDIYVPNGVIDLKTCKHYGFAKDTKEQKAGDPQTLLYLHGTGAEHMRHVYGRKHRAILEQELATELASTDPIVQARTQAQVRSAVVHPQARAFDASFTREEIRTHLHLTVLPQAERLYQLRQRGVRSPLDLEPNADHCEAYGRKCIHVQRCNLSASDILYSAERKQNGMSTGFQFPPTNGPAASNGAAPQQQAWQPPANAQQQPQQPQQPQWAPPAQQPQQAPAQPAWQPPAQAPQQAPAQPAWQPPAQQPQEPQQAMWQPQQSAAAQTGAPSNVGASQASSWTPAPLDETRAMALAKLIMQISELLR